MQTVKVGILGLGTVGAGTASVLQSNRHSIANKAGQEIVVAAASVRSMEGERDCDTSNIQLTQDPFEIVNDPTIDLVVELIGGTEIAKELVEAAINNGKSVITANKALIAMHGNELFVKAQAAGVNLRYEAAVAGGIPIIKSLREGLAANQIEHLVGIINGTTNFILTEMRDKGRTFADVLSEAQELGYAEADPTFDVEGIDAAHKLTILASIAFSVPLQFESVYTEGISNLQLIDVSYARELGYRIKHLGIAKHTAEGLEIRVHPTLIPKRRLIANVDGVMNAVLVKGDAVGNTLHYGAGAGAKPTASAVVADIIDEVRQNGTPLASQVTALGVEHSSLSDTAIKQSPDFECAYYLRFEVRDVAGVMTRLSSHFAEQNISIEGITQKEPEKGQQHVSVIFITQQTKESSVDQVIAEIEAMDDVLAKAVKIRVEHLD